MKFMSCYASLYLEAVHAFVGIKQREIVDVFMTTTLTSLLIEKTKCDTVEGNFNDVSFCTVEFL
jgi:hypothetical protein